jgi:hypothetical protein
MPPRQAATPPTAYGRAILRLARRDHTVAELRRALRERGYPQDEIEQAIERLRAALALDPAAHDLELLLASACETRLRLLREATQLTAPI